MNARVATKMPLLDVAFHLMDSVRSPQDFTLIFHLSSPPDVDSFYAGAKSAMNRFPTSACCTDGYQWVWRENKYFKLEIASTTCVSEIRLAIERFIDEPFDLRRQPPVKQLLILNGPTEARLATRFHHSAADGLSAALWLGHQLNVAYGLEAAEVARTPFAGLSLRRLPKSVHRSDFAFPGASDPLWSSQSKRSGKRRWLTIGFPATKLQNVCRKAGGFTYHDLLATCALEVISLWNSTRNKNGDAKIGLWVPMNIRRDSMSGFGNGTSRMRLYARYKSDASLIEKCREIRRQVSWNTKHGEWVVPEIPWFTRLPRPVIRPLLRTYLNLPSIDMATAVFSHASSWIANAGDAFKHVERIECIGLLHPRQNLAINAATHRGHTWLTLTYDSHILDLADVRQLARMYAQQISAAQEALL